jgi:hypothetical protein
MLRSFLFVAQLAFVIHSVSVRLRNPCQKRPTVWELRLTLYNTMYAQLYANAEPMTSADEMYGIAVK